MNKHQQQTVIVQVLLSRFLNSHLPRAQALCNRVDAGGLLETADIQFLEKIFSDAKEAAPHYAASPDFEQVIIKAIALYHHITDKALENERVKR